ncbi:hypothetical protein TD95_002791 [Thielaviopsis punctulata]|uniref:Uncharacterized protein n=1 Tax=Thielaviopsis punctulata TaxID=72032 RepID=A0A0F4ZJ80_9PEZI|nr:hypothetical protein TD95_002791 [Thielaviopsis punctulata]
MCHGIPRSHPCSHSSVSWSYCPASAIDLKTGYETPCSKTSFARLQATATDCPLRNCAFSELGGSWTCCMCRNGPNQQGWCNFAVCKYVQNQELQCAEMVETTCGHGCCENCNPSQSRANITKSAEGQSKSKSKSKSSSSSSSHKSGTRSRDTKVDAYPSPSSSSASSASSSHRRRGSHVRELTPESPLALEAHLYSFREGYGYCGPLDEEQVWSENSPCSSHSSVSPSPGKNIGVVLDYSKASSKKRDRR